MKIKYRIKINNNLHHHSRKDHEIMKKEMKTGPLLILPMDWNQIHNSFQRTQLKSDNLIKPRKPKTVTMNYGNFECWLTDFNHFFGELIRTELQQAQVRPNNSEAMAFLKC